METKDGKKIIYAETRKEWRKWLQQNSRKEKAVWLIQYHKESNVPCTSYNDAVEEALCFGWIDSLAKNRDDQSFFLTFTPRKPASKWSELNRKRVERMIAEGLMTEQGQQMIDIAIQNGKWEPEQEAV